MLFARTFAARRTEFAASIVQVLARLGPTKRSLVAPPAIVNNCDVCGKITLSMYHVLPPVPPVSVGVNRSPTNLISPAPCR